jgi:hypothetical protein
VLHRNSADRTRLRAVVGAPPNTALNLCKSAQSVDDDGIREKHAALWS